MCGIAGIFNYIERRPADGIIKKMTSSMEHRGPDASGFYHDEHIALGHTRLSIIDLSDCSNQPMHDHSGRYHIVFNGEIYNYQELRYQLKDYPFATNGDTEVILAAYATWGTESFQRLAGMFAFAIWDNPKRELILVRDRLGVKPLYYHDTGSSFLFSSEIRSILASGPVNLTVNNEAVSGFLQFQSVVSPETVVSGIFSLDAGACMTVSAKGRNTYKYWDITTKRNTGAREDRTAIKQKINKLLRQSVQRRMVSDVPVAAFLSGGIDSSAVVGLMAAVSDKPVNTFTVGFEEQEFDESRYANLIAKKFKTNHTQITLKAADFLDDLVPALDAMDTPTGDGINSFVVCRAIRKSGIKVALSGVGGDELFAGYPIFRQYLKLMRYKRLWKSGSPVRHAVAGMLGNNNSRTHRYRQLLRSETADISSFYPGFRQIVSKEMLSDFTTLPLYNDPLTNTDREHLISGYPLLSQVSIAEYLGYTQHTLLKDMDQMSMANSLEVREPFFDHELIEYVLNIPDREKAPHFPKQLLVESLGDLLPEDIVHRRKQGFVLPWKQWMKADLKSFCEKYLKDISQRDFIQEKKLMALWQRFLKDDTHVRWLEIWVFVVLEYWLQKNNVN
jgi:asparagine synthase (glutamine-hydrolysing)